MATLLTSNAKFLRRSTIKSFQRGTWVFLGRFGGDYSVIVFWARLKYGSRAANYSQRIRPSGSPTKTTSYFSSIGIKIFSSSRFHSSPS